jgi:hypothetical protein
MEVIKRIYFKDKELQGQITSDTRSISDFEISVATSEVVSDIQCVQKDRDLWRVYVKSTDSRAKLLTEGFDIRNRHISVYGTNPYSARLRSPNEKVIKVTVKGVPLPVDNSEIMKMLDEFHLNYTSDLKYEKIRNPDTKKKK